MKKNFAALCAIFVSVSAYCGGGLELVNTQEIGLDAVTDIQILYSGAKVSLFAGTADTLVIKEYMNENNSKYYAGVTATGNTVTVEKGRAPFRPLVNVFDRRLEVYLPASYGNAVTVKAGSGKIESPDALACSKITIENSSGSIDISQVTADKIYVKNSSGSINLGSVNGETSVESSSGRIDIGQVTGVLTAKAASGDVRGGQINGNADIRAASGSIIFKYIDGDVSAETKSGRIELNFVTGSVTAKTSSGAVACTSAETAGNLSFNTSSGSVRLNLSKDLRFNFSARTSSGSLKTPFSDKLFTPVADKHLTQGVIGDGAVSENIPAIDIKTSSGSIRVHWID